MNHKREAFTEEYAIRLQTVQIECDDALRIIHRVDRAEAFFYCDPPYYNSDMGHYDGYTIEDFEALLQTLSNIQGRFLLSSYRSEVLSRFIKEHQWHYQEFEKPHDASLKGQRKKIEVLTANYPIDQSTST